MTSFGDQLSAAAINSVRLLGTPTKITSWSWPSRSLCTSTLLPYSAHPSKTPAAKHGMLALTLWARWTKVYTSLHFNEARCPRGSVGRRRRGQTAGGGSIPRWSASKPQVVTRRKAKGAGKKKSCTSMKLHSVQTQIRAAVKLWT